MPLAPRRKALRESFSFDCGCVRCAAEAGVFEAVGPTLEAVAEVGCAPARLQLWHFCNCLPATCCWMLLACNLCCLGATPGATPGTVFTRRVNCLTPTASPQHTCTQSQLRTGDC